MLKGPSPPFTAMAMRAASVCVFPVPAPPRIRTGPMGAVAACRWYRSNGATGDSVVISCTTASQIRVRAPPAGAQPGTPSRPLETRTETPISPQAVVFLMSNYRCESWLLKRLTYTRMPA